jgi:hypothetical protein
MSTWIAVAFAHILFTQLHRRAIEDFVLITQIILTVSAGSAAQLRHPFQCIHLTLPSFLLTAWDVQPQSKGRNSTLLDFNSGMDVGISPVLLEEL